MDQLDIFSVSGSLSQQPSSDNTGQTESSGVTFPSLLPTPIARDWKGAAGASRATKAPQDHLNSLSLQEASPVSHLVPLDEEKERQTTATSGLTCFRSYETLNPNGSSLKTCVASLLGAKAWYSRQSALTWKPKVTKSNRLLFQLSPSVRHTEEIESGLLATPNTMDSMAPKTDKAIHREATVTRPGRTNFANLKEQIAYGKLLPTPDHNDGARGATKVYDPKSKSQSGRTINTLIGSGTGKKLRLQPAMTQWMMGYPDSWTEFPTVEPNGEKKASKPMETA